VYLIRSTELVVDAHFDRVEHSMQPCPLSMLLNYHEGVTNISIQENRAKCSYSFTVGKIINFFKWSSLIDIKSVSSISYVFFVHKCNGL